MDFNQLEKPLLELDPIFEKFANKHSLIITKNQKDCPERSIVWGTNVRCLIQLYLSSETGGYFNLWLCASEDTANERFWKHETPIKAESPRVHRRPVCLSQATLPDSFKLS